MEQGDPSDSGDGFDADPASGLHGGFNEHFDAQFRDQFAGDEAGSNHVEVFDVVTDMVVSRVPPAVGLSPGTAPPTPKPRRPGELITVLSLGWRAGDPMAVHLTVRSTPDHPALPRGNWVVLRDFLRYGLEEPTGDGAVRIQPDVYAQRVQLRLARTRRPAWISAPCNVVRNFLDQTDRLDPTGEERSAEALDAVIARLLER